ncbi:hypothetical protein DITRI_Ditri01bG0116600 [Diplodiscus trichospermus]
MEGSNGLYYDGPPLRAIGLKRKTKFNKLLDELYCITGFNRERTRLNLVCRYPTIVQSPMIKYIRLPIADDRSVEIMLEIPSIHPSISNVELYLDVESIFTEHTEHENHESIGQYDKDTSINLTAVEQLVYSEPNDIFRDMNVINGLLEEENEEQEDQKDFEEVDDAITSNWTLETKSVGWNLDLELRKGLIFQDKAELKRAVQLYSVKRHQMYEVVETKKKIWSLRCKRHQESGCKWRLRAYSCSFKCQGKR